MAFVVFLRGVNVGGNKTFKPSEFAKGLEGWARGRAKAGSSSGGARSLRVINQGAAGTFVVQGKIGAKALRQEIRRRLPFEAEVMICAWEELVELVRSQPFGSKPAARDVKWYVCVLGQRPRTVPRLPIEAPSKKDWQVRVLRVMGPFVACEGRRRERAFLYPNEVVEKTFGVPATTRNWNTIMAICDALAQQRSARAKRNVDASLRPA